MIGGHPLTITLTAPFIRTNKLGDVYQRFLVDRPDILTSKHLDSWNPF